MMEALMAGLANMGCGNFQSPAILKATAEPAITVGSDPGMSVTPAPLFTPGEKDKPAFDKAWQDALLQALCPAPLVIHDSSVATALTVATVATVAAGDHPRFNSTLASPSTASSAWPLQKKQRSIDHISFALPAIVPRPACSQIPQAATTAQGLSAHHSSVADSIRAGEVTALRVSQPVALAGSAQTLRIHAEWGLEGVRLWCGMDSSHPASATELAPQLVRSLNEQGVRLLTLVCNGRAIYADPEEHTPARHIESRDAMQSPQEFPRVQFNPEEFV